MSKTHASASQIDPQWLQEQAQQVVTFYQANELVQAKALAEQLLLLVPKFSTMQQILGLIALQQGEIDRAEKFLRQAFNNNQQDANFAYNLATVLHEQDKIDEAITYYQQSIALNPNLYSAQENIAVCYCLLHQYEKALPVLSQLIKVKPNSVSILTNLAEVYRSIGELDKCQQLLQKALELGSDEPIVYLGLGKLYADQQAHQQAIAAFDQVLAIDPNYGLAKHYRGLSYLSLGELHKGWLDFDDAQAQVHKRMDIRYPVPKWQGEPLTGKSILIIPEQGLGDELIFANCLPDLIEQAGQVHILCDHRLQATYTRTYPRANIVGIKRQKQFIMDKALFKDVDYLSALGSLPHYLRPTLDRFPNPSPHLIPDPDMQKQFNQWLTTLPVGIKIGVAWRSVIKSLARENVFAALAAWQPLFSMQGAVFVNLQTQVTPDELAFIKKSFHCDLQQAPDLDLYDDLEASMALMSQLDWVVSPGVSTAMLAAAVGCNTAIVHKATWESLGTDSFPWFSTVHLVDKQDDNWLKSFTEVLTLIQQKEGQSD